MTFPQKQCYTSVLGFHAGPYNTFLQEDDLGHVVKMPILWPDIPEIWPRKCGRGSGYLHPKCFSGLRTTAKQAEYPGKRMYACWLHLHVPQAFFGIQETRNTSSISVGWWQEKGRLHLSASGKQCHVQGRRWLGSGLRGGGEQGREPHAARGGLFSWCMTQRHQMALTYACHQPPVASDHCGWLSTGQTSSPQPIPNDSVPETSLHPFRHFLKTISTESIRW